MTIVGDPLHHEHQSTAHNATHQNGLHSPGLAHTNANALTVDCHPPRIEDDVVVMASHSHHHHHGPPTTTAWDAWIQLTKAYIGPGCLSLPWAISQLGLPVGTLVIGIVAFWTSYNCWNIVVLKRVILRERAAQAAEREGTQQPQSQPLPQSAAAAEQLSQHHHQVTYPDVGEWAYNKKFKDILLISICVQQLAVCTVFLSFIGENIAAVMERTLHEEGEKAPSHALVITMALPFALLLSCLPNLKVLSPVMLVATLSLFVGFGLLGVVVAQEWEHRPRDDDHTHIEWSQVPMAVCAVLYSYEGICVILPVESAMAEPDKYFGTVFVTSMTFTAIVFASVACLCVVAFGDVTDGSITAFLVETLEDEDVKWWLYMANTACSVAVLLTYPLQLFPSFELIGPWMTRVLRLDIGTHTLIRGSRRAIAMRTSFSPIPSCDNPDDRRVLGNHEYHDQSVVAVTTPTRTTINHSHSSNGTPSTPHEAAIINSNTPPVSNGHDCPNNHNDQNGTNVAAMEFTNGDDAFMDEEYYTDDMNPCAEAFPTPGDSPQLRAILVCFTYVLAIAVPNVQLLVSLAGALSGSATGLIIPPLLELSYIKRQERAIQASIITATEADDDDDGDDTVTTGVASTTTSTMQPTASPAYNATTTRTRPPSMAWLQWKRLECYVLFGLGVVVCVFGTGAALADIVRVYLGDR